MTGTTETRATPTPNLVCRFLDWLGVDRALQRRMLIQQAVFVLSVVLVLLSDPGRLSVDAVVGEVCTRTIICPQDISVDDEAETKRLKDEAEARVEPVVTPHENADQEMQNRLAEFFKQAEKFHADWAKRDVTLIDAPLIASYFGNDALLTLTQLKELTFLSEWDFRRLHDVTSGILTNAMQQTITDRNLDEARADVGRRAQANLRGPRLQAIARDIVQVVVIPNATENVEETIKRRKHASEGIQPVKVTKKRGEKIIDAGTVIDKRDMYLLEKLQAHLHKNWVRRLVGNFLLALAISVITLIHLKAYRRDLLRNPSQLNLLYGIMLVTLILNKVLFLFTPGRENSHALIVFSPLPAAGLLMAILLDGQIAIFQQLLLGILSFVLTDFGARFAIVGLFGGLAGILAWAFVGRDSNFRRQVSVCGLAIGGANVVALLGLLLNDAESVELVNVGLGLFVGASVINGLLSAIVANGSLPLLENFYAVSTNSKLLELADLSQPLLQRMATEAPGTYHHSLNVGTLSEAAAKEISADALLAKIGAFFHDIGKLRRPAYFAENQSEKNAHDRVTPYMSSLILIGHIRDGLDLAREYDLPEKILPFIAQHHGTTLISYFYHQARTSGDSEAVNEEQFRYPGPKPQSKETAIVMLADSVEAAVRTLPQHTRPAIEGLVKKIMGNKINDEGQLDQSDLTLKEIERIEKTFVNVISSMYHARVDYPGAMSNQPKGGVVGNPHQ